jgi:hypothetical protein
VVRIHPLDLRGDIMSRSREERNKAIVWEAFETLFNKRDYRNALNFWSPKYIQHGAHIPPGRDGLIELVKNVPMSMRYDNQLTVAEADYVLLHGRFSGLGEGVPIGSLWILSAWRMEFSPSTGMLFRTKRHVQTRRAGFPCSGIASPSDRSGGR